MKKFRFKRVFTLIVAVSMACTGVSALPGNLQSVYAKDGAKDAIQVLTKKYSIGEIASVGKINAYDEFYGGYDLNIKENLKGHLALANTLTFSNKTTFSEVPDGFDPDELLEWGKYPGLNMDILKKYGFTGSGATIAYIDQPVDTSENEQYKKADVHYTSNVKNGQNSSMHGATVLSLLCGKDTGTAPDATVFYYAHEAWKMDQKTHAKCLYQLIEQNKKLPKNKKITMVGFSDNIDETEKNADALREAVAACEKVGIMVWFCGEYETASFIPNSDKNNFENITVNAKYTSDKLREDWLVYVPASGRTAACDGENTYIYWSAGGLSWTMPYMLGLYGIVKEIDPSLTQDDIRELVVSTAYTNTAGMRIVNPVEFVCTVLERVGQTSTAKKMRQEVKKRSKYTYALMNTALMSNADLTSVNEYLSTITDSTVVVVDAAYFSNSAELYDAIKKDHKKRGGKIAGVQIFGTPDMVPTFSVSYKVKLEKGIDEMGTLLTDYFYSNLDNKSSALNENYSVYKQFKEKEKINLVPEWPVARLTLEKGEFTNFFKTYKSFEKNTGLTMPTIVNFSNPIFEQKEHSDDMGQFLIRMKKEEKLQIKYKLYGNLDGSYPVTTDVLGNFTTANISKENKKGMYEFLINSHGQQNNIDQATFAKGKEKRKSFINSDNINKKLSANPYYLDTWTCNNGYGMKDNLVTTALNGKCVGAFAATTVISNNGVDNKASVSKMKKSNFYYFYYQYLKALSTGSSRSTSFYEAQKAYAKALLTESKKKINYNSNYQFNMYNLLAYHNFGVICSNAAVSSMYDIQCDFTIADTSEVEDNNNSGGNGTATSEVLTNGKPLTEYQKIENVWCEGDDIKVKGASYRELDNGYYRFKVEATLNKNESVIAFDPPNGNNFMLSLGTYKKGAQSFLFDVDKSDVEKGNTITLGFQNGSNMQFIVVNYIIP